jgi:HEAT repeat protein
MWRESNFAGLATIAFGATAILGLFGAKARGGRDAKIRKKYEPILEAATRDEQWDGRAFDDLSDKDAIVLFESLLSSLEDAGDMRRFAARKLIEESALYEALVGALYHEKSAVRLVAIRLIGETRAARALSILRKKLKEEDEEFLEASKSLAKMGDLESLDIIASEGVARSGLSTDDVADVLIEFGAEACPRFRQRLRVEPSESLKTVFVRVIAAFEFRDAAKEIAAALTFARTKTLVVEALRAVGKLKIERAGAIIRPFLYVEDPDVVVEAIRTTASARDAGFEKDLAYKLNDPNERVRIEAADALHDLSNTGRALVAQVAKRKLGEPASEAAKAALEKRELGQTQTPPETR